MRSGANPHSPSRTNEGRGDELSRHRRARRLAADLLAEPSLRSPNRPRRRGARPARGRRRCRRPPLPKPTDGPRTRGPALQTVVRLEPFDWYKPLLRVHWLSVSVRVGPIYGQLGIRRASR